MSEDELLSALTSSKPVRKFSKSKMNEIRTNLYEIENKRNLFASKIKEIERNLTELEENISKTKKYYDYDDTEYKEIRDVKYLFDLSIDEDCYKPKIAKGAFNNNYIQYESKGDKGKNLSIKKYLNMIRKLKVNGEFTQAMK